MSSPSRVSLRTMAPRSAVRRGDRCRRCVIQWESTAGLLLQRLNLCASCAGERLLASGAANRAAAASAPLRGTHDPVARPGYCAAAVAPPPQTPRPSRKPRSYHQPEFGKA
jgi:hypothetical protein